MIQFYFLSVLLNALAGCLLFFGLSPKEDAFRDADANADSGAESFFPPFMQTEGFRFGLGVAAISAGILKFLSPVDVPVAGDILPALAGILAGFSLIYENIRMRKISEKVGQNVYVRKLLDYKTYIGLAAMISAALHFLFPYVVII